ncbi:acyltransferase [Pseudescherichia sp.]|uniref:acyltransferase family protein n=1 Tax=Pseudescherichia sp. TaxID=2055881 RepID=UPI0028B0187A|nr:acyltransferase [Pseudescherichia sp.]
MRKLHSIQALRAIAAVLVVIDHIFSRVEGLSPGSTLFNESAYHYLGEIGVQVFFCISGFIMVHTSNGNGGLSDAIIFLKKRAIRIYPIYIITLLLFVITIKHFAAIYNINFWVDISDSNVAKRLFLMPTFIYGNGWNNILLQSWTLVYEIYFYIIFAFCMIMVSPKNITLLATLFIISIMTIVYFVGGKEDSNTSTYILNVLGSKNLLFFVFGMLVSFSEKYIFKATRAINNSALFYFISSFLICISIMFTNAVSVCGISISILALMYISTIIEINDDGTLNRIIIFLGEASYSLYLMHIFAFIASPYFNVFRLNNNIYCSILSLFAVAIGCIVHISIEKPVVGILNKIYVKKISVITPA